MEEMNISEDANSDILGTKKKFYFTSRGTEKYSLVIEREIILRLHKNSSKLIKFCLIWHVSWREKQELRERDGSWHIIVNFKIFYSAAKTATHIQLRKNLWFFSPLITSQLEEENI